MSSPALLLCVLQGGAKALKDRNEVFFQVATEIKQLAKVRHHRDLLCRCICGISSVWISLRVWALRVIPS